MDVLVVAITPAAGELPPGVRLVVNGDDLLDFVRDAEEPYARGARQRSVAGAYLGVPPAWVLPPSKHFLGEPQGYDFENGKTIMFGCTCCVPECSPLMARVTLTDDTVTWDEFGNPYFPERVLNQLGPFTFNRSQYEDALSEVRRNQATTDIED